MYFEYRVSLAKMAGKKKPKPKTTYGKKKKTSNRY